MKIINYEEKEMIPLTYEENKSYKEQEACHICGESFVWIKMMTIRGTVHSKCNLNYKVPKDIPIIIHNVSYDAHFIINQLAE